MRGVPRCSVDLDGDELTPALLLELNAALRADSPDAPSTHAEAISRGVVWVKAERKELLCSAGGGGRPKESVWDRATS